MQYIFRPGVYYGAFAGMFFLFWFLFKIGGFPDAVHALFSTAIDVAVSMAALLFTVEILLPKLLYTRRYALFFTGYILLVAVCGSVIILSQLRLDGSSLTQYQANILKYPKHYFYWFWADLVFGSYLLVFLISSVGAAVDVAFDRLRAVNLAAQLEKDKIQAELTLLKNQVNPHFLFNALNTIYYKIDRTNQPARDTLERFSGMLRYQLYECDNAFIAIEKEMDFIASYVQLQTERLNENYAVNCAGLENVKGAMLSPFLLLPLVENCFKHVPGNTGGAVFIYIECGLEDGIFRLTTRNTASEINSTTGGIGLENVRKRLNLVYPRRHTLAIQRESGIFDLRLEINTSEA